MATDRQEDLAEAIVINKSLPHYKRKNKKDLVVSVGYSETVADKKATEIIQSKGVQETLSKRGLTKDLITEALVFDIENKPKRRERELRLGAEILGLTEHDKAKNNILIINVSGQSAQRYGADPSTSTDSA